jgi:hypothetical protein
METRNYQCYYCKKEYLPKRRGVQKFCSNSCRVRSHQLKNKPTGKATKSTTLSMVANNNTPEFQKTKIDQISLSGVGNAAIGSGVIELTKAIFTSKEDQPATRKDIERIEVILNQLIKNDEKKCSKPNSIFKPV